MEETLLLAVWKLQDDAYGLAIRRHVSGLFDRTFSVGAIYMPLERLTKKGLLKTWESDPTDKRGGRRKKFYKLTGEGVSALNQVRSFQEKAWAGLPTVLQFNPG